MKKSCISLVLLLCIIALSLTSCGKEESSTTADLATETPSSQEQTTADPDVKEPILSLSGNPEEIITVTENSYYPGEQYVLYFEKGTKIPGDIALRVERTMKELETLFGLSYAKTKYVNPEPWRGEYFGGGFRGINEDHEKVDIIVISNREDGAIEWSDTGTSMLYDEDFDLSQGIYDTVFHELAHVLHLRQGPYLGQAFEEGVGLYAQYQISRKENYPSWTMIQYVDTEGYLPNYDTTALLADAEQEFRHVTTAPRSAEQLHYHYGIRFITFLTETYGEQIIAKISEVSRKYSYEDDDVDAMIRVIKEATEESVFEKFAAWLPEGWEKWCREYNTFMESFG